MSIEPNRSALGVSVSIDAIPIFRQTIGDPRSGRHYIRRPVATRNPALVEWWNQSNVVRSWSEEGGGIVHADREVVSSRLRDSGFYIGVSKQSKFLDLAVGAKSYLDADYIPAGADVHAVDLSQAMLDALRVSEQEGDVQLHTDFRVMDATSLEYPDNYFDRSLSSFMMRYLSEDQQREAILEMIRVTQNGGRIDIFDFNNVPRKYPNQISWFTPTVVKTFLTNPSFEQRLKALGAQIEVTMDELPRTRQPFSAKLYCLRFDVRK